jgi:hypothetical protein
VFARVLRAIAVIRTAKTKRKIKSIISVVQVQMRHSEVLFAPLRFIIFNRSYGSVLKTA